MAYAYWCGTHFSALDLVFHAYVTYWLETFKIFTNISNLKKRPTDRLSGRQIDGHTLLILTRWKDKGDDPKWNDIPCNSRIKFFCQLEKPGNLKVK